MRVLITGINGFTGVYLENYFEKKGYEVFGTVIGSPTLANHFQCDIIKKEQIDSVIQKVVPDFIIHTAGLAHVTTNAASKIYEVNVIGTENLLQSVVDNNLRPKKIILASSATIYGNQGHSILDESMMPKPVNHYGCSKLAMEHMSANFFNRLDIIIVRPFNYTGAGQDASFLIPKIVSHYKENKKSIELGNLHVAREFNDVRDIVVMYEQLMLCKATSLSVNLCTSRAIPLLQIIDNMNVLAGYEIDVTINPAFVRENEIKILKGSTELLNSIIDYRPEYTIMDTLKEKFQ